MGMNAEPARSAPGVAAVEEARRLYRVAEELETHHDRARHVDALKTYLAFVEGRRSVLEEAAVEVARHLDESSMAFYRLAQPDLASRAVEVGLAYAPGSSSLLHHKALIMIGSNRSIGEALTVLEGALQANPHDKGIWATRGDALKLLDRPAEAAESYLRAQQLDATSLQYVDRALKLVPNHPVALRMRLQLARAHGGERQALEACDELLKTSPDDPELLFARAELLSTLGQLPQAIEALDLARAKRSNDPRLAYLQAKVFLAAGRPDDALRGFHQLIDQGATLDAGQLAEVAQAAEGANGDIELAIQARQKLKELEPRNLANLHSLRAIAGRTGRHELGIAACRAILEVSPENLEGLRALAELQAAAGDRESAFESLRQLAHAHPNEVPELAKALEFARRDGPPAMVEEFARAVLAADPRHVGALDALAEALVAKGEKEAALVVYDQLIMLEPDRVPPLLAKKSLLTDLDRGDELTSVFDELFRLDPTRADLALERGNLWLARAFDRPQGSPEREKAARDALVSYERASLDPALAGKSLLGLARASRLVGDHGRAITAYQSFLEEPSHVGRSDILKELGHALRETGRLTEAEQVYSRAVQLGLEDPDLFWGEVEVLSLLNREAAALRFVDLLLQREPQNPMFLRRKGQLLLKAGRRAEGLQVLKSAVQGTSGDPHIHFEVAEALRSQGAYADAVTYFQAGLAVDAKSRPGRLALAETMVLAGQYAGAIPLVDSLLKEDPNDLAAWRTRADAYRALGRSNEVQYSLKAVLLLEPHHGGALIEKFRLHVAAGEHAEAFETLSLLLDGGGSESRDAALWLQLGDLGARLGRVDEANHAYEKAGQLDPAQLAEIAARRARLRLGAGRPDLALEVLDATLKELAPGVEKPVTALLLRAEILAALERAGEAQRVYEDVLRREPRSPVAIAGYARTLLDQGKHAEGKEYLRQAIPQLPPQENLFLLLAESESGLGALPDAVYAVQKGTEVLPRSAALWVRWGELEIAQEKWTEAASAFAHAIALDASNPDWQLRAGFVAEKLGHPHEALALYERATEVAPSNKYAWCSRGVALLALGRPEEAQASFDRSLALDSDFDAAKDGRKAALQKTREGQIERHGRDALLLEAKLNRSVTKNDLFVSLHVPFDLLEPVLSALTRNPKIDIDRLSEAELHDLESASYHLVTSALERRPEGIERRGFTLADVAVLSPDTYTLNQVQRLFGYLRSVLDADLRAENLKLTPDVEELARRALLLPENQRTLFQLVRTLKVGLFKARLIKVVESAGSAVHAPLPTLDFGAYAPGPGREATEEDEGRRYFDPENEPTLSAPPGTERGTRSPVASWAPATSSGMAGSATGLRCVGCGGLASIKHDCGAAVCQHCIAEFHTCPKCGKAVTPANSRTIGTGAPSGPDSGASRGHARGPEGDRTAGHPGKPVPGRGHPPAAKPAPPQAHPVGTADPRRFEHLPPIPAGGTSQLGEPPAKPPRLREKPDDEPRL